MKLEYSTVDALDNSRNNPARAWTTARNFAPVSDRLKSGSFFDIYHKPKFLIDPNDSIFTMGSCFAREVENVLIGRKMNLVLHDQGVPVEYLASWTAETGAPRGTLTRGALNKYSVHSMSHEIKRSLLTMEYENNGLIELDADKWFDPHASSLRLVPLDEAEINRRRIEEATACVTKADVIFLTLGLTETWLDVETGLAINNHPGAVWLNKLPNRFRFVDYGFNEIVAELRSMIDVVRSQVKADMRFVITVSPVPLGSTFRTQDVLVASSGSKSVLRAVADDLYREDPLIDYFPSYEYVTNSPRNLAWLDDQLHVSRPMVQHVMERFEAAYFQ